jgi:hypothetical protein
MNRLSRYTGLTNDREYFVHCFVDSSGEKVVIGHDLRAPIELQGNIDTGGGSLSHNGE